MAFYFKAFRFIYQVVIVIQRYIFGLSVQFTPVKIAHNQITISMHYLYKF